MNKPFYLFWTRADYLNIALFATLMLIAIITGILGYRFTERRLAWMEAEHCRRIVDIRDSGPPHSLWQCDHESFWQGD